MKTPSLLIAAAALGLAASGARAADLNVVEAIDLRADGAGAQVSIAARRAPTFTAFRLADPARVVVDLAGADVTAVRGEREGVGPVLGVTASQIAGEKAAVGRVVVALAEGTSYDVRSQDNQVLVAVRPAAEAGAEPAAPAASAEPRPALAPAAAADGVVARKVDRAAPGTRPGTAVRSAAQVRSGGRPAVRLTTDGEVGTFELIELDNPPRLAIDLFGFRKAPRAPLAGGSLPVREVRFGRHEDKVRVVLDAGPAERLPPYDVKRVKGGLLIALGEPKAPAPEPARSTRAEPEKALAAAPAQPGVIGDVVFRGNETRGRVLIAVPKGATWEASRPDPRTALLTIRNAQLPKRLERSLDTSAFNGPVKMVSSFAAPGQEATVQVVAALDAAVEDRLSLKRGQLVWELTAADSLEPEMVLDGQRLSLAETSASSARARGQVVDTGDLVVGRPKYTGRRVSFEFKDIDIHNLLRIIAEVSKRNVVVADNVSGKVTIRLRNVPWDQALDLILKSKGLDKEEIGNIIRVAPAKELDEERRLAAEQARLRAGMEPLKVRLIPVNYATAREIASRVKDVLSERGTISVDQRTNTLIVKDVLEALARAEGLVRRLDSQTPQVLIEARIVEANSSFSREFGIQWGGNVGFSPATGNPTGLVFPNVVRIAGASTSEGNAGTADVPNFAVNMPAAIGTGVGGAVGMVLGSAGGSVALNLRLSAMESNGQIKTISAPKITTLDNTEATIGQGISIPFSQVSAAGVNTTFVEAKLELRVTPHITADGSVLMDITATNNQPDSGFTGANGQPAISKKEAKTQVLVKDGDTTVIGGIFTRSQSLNQASVPLLAKIPVLGWLFKNKREIDNRTELLIFITPRIVNRNQMVVTGEYTP